MISRTNALGVRAPDLDILTLRCEDIQREQYSRITRYEFLVVMYADDIIRLDRGQLCRDTSRLPIGATTYFNLFHPTHYYYHLHPLLFSILSKNITLYSLS